MSENEAVGLLGALVVAFLTLAILLSPFLVLLVGGLVGAAQERQHFRELSDRERGMAGLLVTNLKSPPPGMAVGRAALVTGSVVIAADHFKTFRAKWRKIFGGRFDALARMQERARREAILRMLELARSQGATAVCNVRVETSSIAGNQPGKVSGSELIAYGTALIPASPGVAGPPPIHVSS
jgi:uncharacterized protein YbjQ (UPF0145 family)